MRAALFVLVLISAAPLAAEPDPAMLQNLARTSISAKPCKLPAPDYAGKREAAPRAGRLDRQPLADQYLGVMHVVDGCEKPIKTRQGIGGGIEGRR